MTIRLDSSPQSLDLAPHANEPLSLLASPVDCPPAFASARVERLEFSCRGDRVPCHLIVPAGEGPFPLVLIQPVANSADADTLTTLERASGWVDAGCALASIELPLAGERRSAKLSELLAETVRRATAGETIDGPAALLWLEFTRQAVLELRRTLDLVAALPTIDAAHIGYAGFGPGAFAGCLACAVDSHVSAAVLAGAGSGIAPEAIAPESFVERIAPRPLLFVNDPDGAGEKDPGAVPRRAAEELHAAAGEPKQVEWQPRPNHALETAWSFLSKALGV